MPTQKATVPKSVQDFSMVLANYPLRQGEGALSLYLPPKYANAEAATVRVPILRSRLQYGCLCKFPLLGPTANIRPLGRDHSQCFGEQIKLNAEALSFFLPNFGGHDVPYLESQWPIKMGFLVSMLD